MRSPFIAKAFVGPRHDWDARVRKGRAPRDAEDMPRHVGITDSHRRGYNRKERTCSYAFIKRWLRAQIGRPWDAVWSEVCAQADARSDAGASLRDHVQNQVELLTSRAEDGRLVVSSPYLGTVGASGLVVDPEGILRLIDGPRPARNAAPVTRVVLATDRELHLVEGLWYEFRFAPLPPVTITPIDRADGTVWLRTNDPGAYDALLGRTVWRRDGWRNPNKAGRYDRERETYAAEKRALSREALRRHGLVNDPDAKPLQSRRRRGERH